MVWLLSGIAGVLADRGLAAVLSHEAGKAVKSVEKAGWSDNCNL